MPDATDTVPALPTTWGDVLPARPSALPKLAACPCYAGKPGTSEAAERGTRVDSWIRGALVGDDEYRVKAPADELRAVEWAVAKVRELALGERVYAREEECRAESALPRLVASGTMDAVCPSLDWLADFKTGQVRDYSAQMAAYALACMDTYFADEWTIHLLFVDQQIVETFKFDRTNAIAYIHEITEQDFKPIYCDYCKWCARYTTCPALAAMARQAVDAAAELPAPTKSALTAAKKGEVIPSFLAPILADPDQAATFCDAVDVAVGWEEVVKDAMKSRMAESGERKLGRWTLSSCKGRESVPPDVVGHYIKELGFGPVLTAYGALPAAKFRELWDAKFGGREDKPFPAEKITQGAGYSTLRRTKPEKQPTQQTIQTKDNQ